MTFLAILTVFLLHILVFGGLYVFLSLWEKWKQNNTNSEDKSQDKNVSKKERVMSIDAFRG